MIIEKDITISLFKSFEQAKLVWDVFEKKHDCYAFQSFNWLKTWYDTVGIHYKLEICIVLVEYPVGVPSMLLPLGIEHRRLISRLVWLGGRITDYHAPLLSHNCSEKLTHQIFQSIWLKIQTVLPPFDVICFEKIPEIVASQRNPFLYLSCSPNASSAYFSQLTGPFDTFLYANRSKKSISTEKRKQRRLKEHGKIDFRIAKNDQDIQYFLGKMITQKTRSYMELGVPILFEQPGYQDFFKAMSENHIKNCFVHLSALTLDNQILATHWGLVYKKRFYHLLPTFEQCKFTKYSPGNLLLWNLLDWCTENNIEIYDFTIGDESYKSHWCDKELKLYDFYSSNTIIGKFYIYPLQVLRTLKRKIKKTPLLLKFSKWIRTKLP